MLYDQFMAQEVMITELSIKALMVNVVKANLVAKQYIYGDGRID